MSKKITVGLCQINAGFSGANYLPYSIGLLEANARKNVKNIDNFHFLPHVFMRESVNTVVEKLLPADIVGFSLYVWNNRLSLAIAKELKARKPEIIMVVGGPHVPDLLKSQPQKKLASARIETYLKENRFIDIAIHGEGEEPFVFFLENAFGDWGNIPSASYINKQGNFVQTERTPRLKDLDKLPSPYLEGTFDPIIEAYPNMEWITVWETNRGCPFSCTFCDWGSAVASKINKWDINRAYREMDWFIEHRVQFIFLADANFGILSRDVEIAKYCAEVKKRTGYPNTITVSNTKNATDRSYQVQKLFAEAGLAAGASLSMQSLDPGTLRDIKRDNISLESYEEIQRRMKRDGIAAFTDIVLGLPGETYNSFVNGIDRLIQNGLHDRVLFYNLTILPNAEMGDPDYQKLHGMETVQIRSVNIHGSIRETEDDISEMQEVVIATKTMPKEDWVRVCVFRWTSAFLHFDKVFQIPIVIAHRLTGVSYRELIELFSDGYFGLAEEFPTLNKIRQFFIAKAQAIQRGEEEFCHSKEWLDMWWPSDEYMLIDLARNQNLSSFYEEAGEALRRVLRGHGKSEYESALWEAVSLNEQLLKLPFVSEKRNIYLTHNIWQFYRAAITNEPIKLISQNSIFNIDCQSQQWHSWEEWYRFVVWYGSKRSAYLYDRVAVI